MHCWCVVSLGHEFLYHRIAISFGLKPISGVRHSHVKDLVSKTWCTSTIERSNCSGCTRFQPKTAYEAGPALHVRNYRFVQQLYKRKLYFSGQGIAAWSGCESDCLRSYVSGEILSSSCSELRYSPLHTYRASVPLDACRDIDAPLCFFLILAS